MEDKLSDKLICGLRSEDIQTMLLIGANLTFQRHWSWSNAIYKHRREERTAVEGVYKHECSGTKRPRLALSIQTSIKLAVSVVNFHTLQAVRIVLELEGMQ